MWYSIASSLIPFAIDIIVKYIQSSDSSKDDMVLEIVKTGADYLAKKDNNDLSFDDCKKIQSVKMRG